MRNWACSGCGASFSTDAGIRCRCYLFCRGRFDECCLLFCIPAFLSTCHQVCQHAVVHGRLPRFPRRQLCQQSMQHAPLTACRRCSILVCVGPSHRRRCCCVCFRWRCLLICIPDSSQTGKRMRQHEHLRVCLTASLAGTCAKQPKPTNRKANGRAGRLVCRLFSITPTIALTCFLQSVDAGSCGKGGAAAAPALNLPAIAVVATADGAAAFPAEPATVNCLQWDKRLLDFGC